LHRIGADTEHDRNARGRSLGGERSRRAEWGSDNGHPAPHQIGRQFRQAIDLIVGPPKLDRHALAFDMPVSLKPLRNPAIRGASSSGGP